MASAARLIVILVGAFFFHGLALRGHSTCVPSQLEKKSVSTEFRWNWKSRQELSIEQSLRKAKLPFQRKKLIASAIMEQIRPRMADLEIQSEQELEKIAFDTRVRMIDLDGDGVPEVVAQGQGMAVCGATGNCPFWVFRRVKAGYALILAGVAQTFTIQPSRTRFRDIVLSRHSSASSGEISQYQYRKGIYEDVGCYDYDWTPWEPDGIRELKEPHITSCSDVAR